MDQLSRARERMLRKELRGRGISDERVLASMGRVPREEFVDPQQRSHAYDDSALPIARGQTISQPTTVMNMLQLLAGNQQCPMVFTECTVLYLLLML